MNTTIINRLSNSKYNAIADGADYITLFTPTYNRAQFLERVYKMMLDQTSKEFVWIIVNDGSSDDTDLIVRKILNEDKLPILYLNKYNGGKHSAFKVALDNCKTTYFQCMDDDDIYSPDSVKLYIDAWNEIIQEGRNDIGAIRTIAIYKKNGKFVSDNPGLIPDSKREDASTLEMNYHRKHHQEDWTCYRTKALLDIDLFPEEYWMSDVHTFFSEGIWQGRFARKYICRYLYTPVREYTDDAEFSLVRAKKNEQHYINKFINEKFYLDEQSDYISSSPSDLLKRIVILQLLRGYLDISLTELLNHTKSKSLKILYIITSAFSICGKKIINAR